MGAPGRRSLLGAQLRPLGRRVIAIWLRAAYATSGAWSQRGVGCCCRVPVQVSDRVQGWPKFQLQVYQEDIFGRNELVGYGFVHVPCAPGTHDLECSCWRPMSSSWNDEVNAFFVGGNPQLKAVDMISSNIDRCVRLL